MDCFIDARMTTRAGNVRGLSEDKRKYHGKCDEDKHDVKCESLCLPYPYILLHCSNNWLCQVQVA